MLICPQCEFENPEDHKYCQNCGISLTHKVCCECQASIPIEVKNCSFCNAVNHTTLWAIITQNDSATETEEATGDSIAQQRQELEEKLKINNIAEFFNQDLHQQVPYLDFETESEHNSSRYTIEDDSDSIQNFPSFTDNPHNIIFQGKAIDKYPLQKSHLATLQKQQMDLFTELGRDLDRSYLSVSQYWNLVGIPTHALPYLILEKYTPTVPKIYDAWQQSDRGVVLLPDRSQWKLLTELWSQKNLPLLQIIWFLDEMAKLWEPLSHIGCAQSLLVSSNLRTDEDRTFCLQQLYMDLEDKSPSLKDLATVWQLCFTESNLNDLDNLNRLLDRVISGEIIEVEQLRLELHNLGLAEDEIESFDIHSNYPSANMTTSESNNIQSSDRDVESQEQLGFFNEEEEDMMYSSEFEEQATAMIPMQLRTVTDASCTNIGSQRDHNEDFFGVKTVIEKNENNSENSVTVKGLYIVCDGMGGHAAGEVASAMAVEQLQKYFKTHQQDDLPDRETIEEGILLTNDTLYQTNLDNSRSGSGRMGTTLVMALLKDTNLAIAHVGDSRIYRVSRKLGLEQLTLDHEVGQREINRGVEPDIAYGRPDAYQLTQALGPRENNYVRPDIQFMEVTEDCLLLLCSDGLCDNNLLEEHWQQYLEPLISSESDLQKGLFELVNFANEYNGHDNITAILVRVKLKPDF